MQSERNQYSCSQHQSTSVRNETTCRQHHMMEMITKTKETVQSKRTKSHEAQARHKANKSSTFTQAAFTHTSAERHHHKQHAHTCNHAIQHSLRSTGTLLLGVFQIGVCWAHCTTLCKHNARQFQCNNNAPTYACSVLIVTPARESVSANIVDRAACTAGPVAEAAHKACMSLLLRICESSTRYRQSLSSAEGRDSSRKHLAAGHPWKTIPRKCWSWSTDPAADARHDLTKGSSNSGLTVKAVTQVKGTGRGGNDDTKTNPQSSIMHPN